MKKYLLIISIILTSCAQNTEQLDLNINENLSFEEFKTKLEVYAKNNPYPDIDN